MPSACTRNKAPCLHPNLLGRPKSRVNTHDMTRSTTPDTQSVVVPSKVYMCLITLLLASIGIKYQSLNTNPFQQSSPSMLLFLTATSSHVIAQTAKISLPTVIIFHVSGVTACETLLWILVTEIWRCIIINVLLLLVTTLCFYYKHIYELLTKLQGTCFTCLLVLKTCSKGRQKGLNANQMTNLKGQECARMTDLAPANTMTPMKIQVYVRRKYWAAEELGQREGECASPSL